MNLILFGPPGGGKGTQADLLTSKYNLNKISTGDLLREEILKKTNLGKKIKETVDKGKLISDNLINKLIENVLKEKINSNQIIFDGYPRTLNQANTLNILLTKYNLKISCVLSLNVSLDTLIKRVAGRKYCSKCNKIFNDHFYPSTNKNHKCGNSYLSKRPDDNEDTIKNRYKTYLDETVPVLKFYENTSTLYKIDGELEINEISQQIYNIMDSING